MIHDVDDLRTSLTARAGQSAFTVSFDQVRRRARRQRRRTVVVTAVAVLVVLASVVPIALLRSDAPTPTLDLSKDDLPRPEKGWRIVDDPIDTGVRSGLDDGVTVLWFAVHTDGAVRLHAGHYDAASDRVRHSDTANLRNIPVLPVSSQSGNHSVGGRVPDSDSMGIGLYYGEDVERIEYVSKRGLYQEGEQTVIEAKLARLSIDPNVIAFWTGPVRMRPIAPVGEETQFTLRAYDADNKVLEDDGPWDPDSDFDPATAPVLGELIRTGVNARPGVEVVAALHGRNGWAGLVLGRRHTKTGKVTDLVASATPMELPLGRTGPLPPPTGTPLTDGRALVLGLAKGCDEYEPVPGTRPISALRTATWSEDPRVTVWWLVFDSDDVISKPGGLPGVRCA